MVTQSDCSHIAYVNPDWSVFIERHFSTFKAA